MNTRSASVTPFGSDREVRELVQRFERCSLTRADWNHRAHLAVAVWYMTHHTEAEARDLMVGGIRRFNRATGVERSRRGGYHETLTLFWVGVARRIVAWSSEDAPLHLVNRALSLPKTLPLESYSEDLLWSGEARARWVEPNLQSLDEVASLAMRKTVAVDDALLVPHGGTNVLST